MKKIHLVTIDPQNDFCIANEFDGLGLSADVRKALQTVERHAALPVLGADKDMERLAAFITANQNRIAEVHCTLDSHQLIHIAHPIFWVNSRGESPKPFTTITVSDVRNGVWRCFHPGLQQHALHYVETLQANGRYELTVWPPHCLIGSWGHSVVPSVLKAFQAWESRQDNPNRVNFITKGSNFLTEHYSGVCADVPDDGDKTTQLNTDFIDVVAEADEIWLTGEALSHCVANTVRDIANNFGDDNIKKFVLLEDTTSNGPGFEAKGTAFVKEMVGRGMRLAKTTTL